MKIERVKHRREVQLHTVEPGQKFWSQGREYLKVTVPYTHGEYALRRSLQPTDVIWDSNLAKFSEGGLALVEIEEKEELLPPKTAIRNAKRGQIVEIEHDRFAVVKATYGSYVYVVFLEDSGFSDSETDYPGSHLVTVHDDIKIVIGGGK